MVDTANGTSTMMHSAIFMDDDEWPTLSVGGGVLVSDEHSSSPHATEDWEMLQPEADPLAFELDESTQTHCSELSSTTTTAGPNSKAVSNRKLLRHYDSSPILSALDRIVEQTPSALNLPESLHEEDDSFALVSDPPSVLTITTTTLAGSVSWADLAGARLQHHPTSPSTTPPHATRINNAKSRSEARVRIQPKFVVVHTPSFQPMRRCSKSTGDLQVLVAPMEDDDYDDDAHGGGVAAVTGACDAMEFYNRKAAGAVARTNGLKLRPDERARKQIIMNKKSEQRQKQQQEQQQQHSNKRKPS